MSRAKGKPPPKRKGKEAITWMPHVLHGSWLPAQDGSLGWSDARHLPRKTLQFWVQERGNSIQKHTQAGSQQLEAWERIFKGRSGS